MRLLLKLSPNRIPVDFNHLHILTGALHKWLGPNEEHDGLSLYSFSWLKGSVVRNNALHFPSGAQWHISAIDGDFLARSIAGIFRDPGIRWGMQVEKAEILAPPPFPVGVSEQRFLLLGPVFIKRSIPNPNKPNGWEDKHYVYTDPESDALLTDTLRHKLRVAGLPDEGVSVRFDRAYPKAKTQKVMHRNIGNMASYCPVFVRGTAEQLAFAWTVGVGNSTGAGFGAVGVGE